MHRWAKQCDHRKHVEMAFQCERKKCGYAQCNIFVIRIPRKEPSPPCPLSHYFLYVELRKVEVLDEKTMGEGS